MDKLKEMSLLDPERAKFGVEGGHSDMLTYSIHLRTDPNLPDDVITNAIPELYSVLDAFDQSDELKPTGGRNHIAREGFRQAWLRGRIPLCLMTYGQASKVIKLLSDNNQG